MRYSSLVILIQYSINTVDDIVYNRYAGYTIDSCTLSYIKKKH